MAAVLQSVSDRHGFSQNFHRVEENLFAIRATKDRLLETNIKGVIPTVEFKQRSEGFSARIKVLEEIRAALVLTISDRIAVKKGSAKGKILRCRGQAIF